MICVLVVVEKNTRIVMENQNNIQPVKSRLFFLKLILICFVLIRCSSLQSQEKMEIVEGKKVFLSDTVITIQIEGRPVSIQGVSEKKECLGTILVLPGFNFSRLDWCEKVPALCKMAKDSGFVLVFPEMGKSVYASRFYLETRIDLQQFPTRKWLSDTVINHLRESYGLFDTLGNNYIVGLSTGARGAALLYTDLPKLFAAIALLSGDFDQTQMPKDNLMTLYYGPYEKNKERWELVDNVATKLQNWVCPTYIGHGQKDKIVPPSQSKWLAERLKNQKIQVVLHEPEMGHDYSYWGSETQNVLNFFKKHKK
jgi:pimeloyl-ACP methyl ester carboxylesterase